MVQSRQPRSAHGPDVRQDQWYPCDREWARNRRREELGKYICNVVAGSQKRGLGHPLGEPGQSRHVRVVQGGTQVQPSGDGRTRPPLRATSDDLGIPGPTIPFLQDSGEVLGTDRSARVVLPAVPGAHHCWHSQTRLLDLAVVDVS